MSTHIKGNPILVFDSASVGAVSRAVDCRAYNAVHLDVFRVSGTGSCTVRLIGAPESGATYKNLPDPNSVQNFYGSADESLDVLVGTRWIRVSLVITGSGTAYSVWVTPFLLPSALPARGLTPVRLRDLSATVAAIFAHRTDLETGVARLAGLQIENDQAAPAYVSLFDVTDAAQVTLGTTLPTLQYRVPGSSSRDVDCPADGIRFDKSIYAASTTTAAGAIGSAAGVYVNAQYQG